MKECLVDACCQLLHSMGGRIANPRMTAETMQLLCDRFSVRRFCMMPLYNAEEETVKHFLSRRRAAIEDLRPQLPKGLHTDILARVLLSPALYQTEDLDRLVVLKSRYLPIFLPLIPYAEWMEEEINHLLYKAGMDLLFTSFELYTVLYPKDFLERMLRVQYAAYQFNYRSLADPAHCAIMSRLLMQGKRVFLGCSLDGPEKAYAYEMDYYLECGKRHLPSVLFRELLQCNASFPRCFS